MALKQWVNLPKDAKFDEPGVTKDRRGPIIMELEFKKADPPKPWKVKVTPEGSDNITYSRKEMGRNKHFKLQNYIAFGVSQDTKVNLDNCVSLPAAGGNTYKIEAQDSSGKAVGSALTLETRRKIYYQVICMKGVTPPSMSGMEDEFWNPAKKYYLKLDAPKPQGEMKHYSNINSDKWDGVRCRKDMFKQCKKAYKLKDLHPFTFVIACSKSIGSTKDITFKHPFTLWGKLFAKNDAEFEVTLPDDQALWFGVDDIDDKKNGGKGIWLQTEVKFNDGKTAPILLDKAAVSLGPKTGRWYQKIKIKVKADLRHKIKARKGKLEISVVTVGGFSGGYSDPMANFITIGSAGWDASYSESKKVQILIHEVGHKVGMVADGKGRSPAAPPNLYGHIRTGAGANNKGHSGPHCEKGMSYNSGTSKWTGTPGCVMFGATSGGGSKTPSTFCSDCEKAVRKLDCDSRVLANFKKFVTSY
jgi:hypothetical protein